MRIKASKKQNKGTFGEGNDCVEQYSRRASLVNEFCLDEVTLISDEGSKNETTRSGPLRCVDVN